MFHRFHCHWLVGQLGCEWDPFLAVGHVRVLVDVIVIIWGGDMGSSIGLVVMQSVSVESCL